MPTITRRFEWDAAHRVLNHESKCKNLHGHRYSAEVTVSTPELDAIGRVVDFGVLKSIIGKWIDDHWDHNILLNSEDPLFAFRGSMTSMRHAGIFGAIFGDKEPFDFRGMNLLEGSKGINPTAEVIAECLFGVCRKLLPKEISVVRIRVYETPNCWADFPSLVGPERYE